LPLPGGFCLGSGLLNVGVGNQGGLVEGVGPSEVVRILQPGGFEGHVELSVVGMGFQGIQDLLFDGKPDNAVQLPDGFSFSEVVLFIMP
jgi:hypothetical protein